MTMLETVRLAWRSLARNGLRTLLTMLGLIIGVSAVIVMLALGNGAKLSIEKSISSLGTNTIMIGAGSVSSGGAHSGAFGSATLTPADAAALSRESRLLSAVSPITQNGSQVVAGNRNWSTNVSGVGLDFLTIRSWKVERGRYFDRTEERTSAKVAVLGRSVADTLFPDGRPLGRTVRLGTVPVRVVGVLEVKGTAQFGNDQDDIVLVPYTTAMKRLFKTSGLRGILASTSDERWVDAAVQEITSLLSRRHGIKKGQDPDFTVNTQAEFAQRAAETATALTGLLAGIASVSLLVGGVGVMNIMLVSVSERVKEIGIRLAVGARSSDIRRQFLVESVLLCLLGGGMGVLLAVLVTRIGQRVTAFPLPISAGSVALAFGFSVATGVFFGLYPAVKASRMDPIEALRSE